MSTALLPLLIDTDMGVDDAAAVAFIISQRIIPTRIIGISAVWGNARVEQVTNNVHALLNAMGCSDIPVCSGEANPLRGKRLGIGAMMHGLDGLWGHSRPQTTPKSSTDLIAWYQRLAEQNDGATLLTLGPLTNIARVLEHAPLVLQSFSRIVILGGSWHGGSITPTAETNVWQDPDAAQRIFSANLPITLVTRDAHTKFTIDPEDLDAIKTSHTSAAQFIGKPLAKYALAQSQFRYAVSCADVVAAAISLDESFATSTHRGLVKVVTGDDFLVRGQTVMGFSAFEKIPMIETLANIDPILQRRLADPTFDFDGALAAILAREPDNANVVLDIDAVRIKKVFLEAITGEWRS